MIGIDDRLRRIRNLATIPKGSEGRFDHRQGVDEETPGITRHGLIAEVGSVRARGVVNGSQQQGHVFEFRHGRTAFQRMPRAHCVLVQHHRGCALCSTRDVCAARDFGRQDPQILFGLCDIQRQDFRFVVVRRCRISPADPFGGRLPGFGCCGFVNVAA